MSVQLTILNDNNTLIDHYYAGEPAFCLYLEENGTKILLDTGYSDIAFRNAEKMHLYLSDLSYIVLSHGHNDHTGGLEYLFASISDKTTLIAHPDVFLPKKWDGLVIGSPLLKQDVQKHCRMSLTKDPYPLTDHILFLGEIPRVVPFEDGLHIGQVLKNSRWRRDDLPDDSALVYHDDNGLFILTGCSHSGICNIISYAEALFPSLPVTGVLGGFHLLENDRRLVETIAFLKAHVKGRIYPCHCVSLYARSQMMRILDTAETGVGYSISSDDSICVHKREWIR